MSEVQKSCGCVFCDLGMQPEELPRGTWVHSFSNRDTPPSNKRVKCRRGQPVSEPPPK